MKHALGSLFFLWAAAFGGACASEPELLRYCDPPDFDGFPSSGSEGIVYVEARLDPSHASDLGTDLLARSIVPVKLSLQLRGKGAEERIIRLEPDRWDMRLYLPDGTVVAGVSAEKAARGLDEDDAPAVQKRAFQPTLIGTQPSEGYLYFALDPKRFRVDGRACTHREQKFTRPLRLADSLLAFNLTDGDSVVPCFVGIRP